MTQLAERVSTLEDLMEMLVQESLKTQMGFQSLQEERRARSAEFDREMKEFKAQMRQAREDSDRKMEEFKAQMQQAREDSRREIKEFKAENQKRMDAFEEKSMAERKKMWKQWGELANKMGTIVEDIVAPGLRGIGREYFQIDEFDCFAPRMRLRRDNGSRTREFDVVAYSPKYFFLVETKSSGRISHISTFIDFIPEISEWFPSETKERILVPVFASLYLDDAAIAYLTKNNILAMATKDDGMDIYNPEVIERL